MAPLILTLVRHGESIDNLTCKLSNKFSEDYDQHVLDQHSGLDIETPLYRLMVLIRHYDLVNTSRTYQLQVCLPHS